MASKNSEVSSAREGIAGRESRLIDFNIVDEDFKKEFIECIQRGGKLRLVMDERILPNGEFGAYSQLID